MRLIICILALALLMVGCGEDNPTIVQSETDFYKVFIEEAGLELTFDFSLAGPKVITVFNHNQLTVGVLLEDEEDDSVVLFKDYWISFGESSSQQTFLLEQHHRINVHVWVYDSAFSAVVGWAIGFFGEGFRIWLEEQFGEDWLYDEYHGTIILE